METKRELVSLGLTEKKADEVMMLESEMLRRAVKFQFRKKDGSVRNAVGTLVRAKMIQEDGNVWEPKGTVRAEVPSLLNYWDLIVKDWRCLSVANLISVEV